jgi:hypothetical protein
MRDPWRLCFAMCCCLLVVPLWVTDLLPLVDVPQHAAQLAIALRWPDGGFPYSHYFKINWIANSLAPYALSFLFALVFPISVALKLVLCLALVGFVLATWRLVTTLRGDRWWVFAAFPVAYGFAFTWGFVPFVLAAPLGLLLIDTAIHYRGTPTRSRAWTMTGLVYLLFACHVLVLAYAGLVSAIIVMSAPTWRARIAGSLALASVLPLVAAWWLATTVLTPGTTPMPAPLVLNYGGARALLLFGHLVGGLNLRRVDVLHGLLVTMVPFLIGARPTRTWWRYAPLAIAILFQFVVPMNVLGTALVYPRFTLFVIPGLLIALESPSGRPSLARAASVALAVLSIVIVIVRFQAFGVESRQVATLLITLEPNKRLLSLVQDTQSRTVPGFPYLHVGCWYQVERGGIADFSFAEFFPNRFRYKPGMDPPLPYNFEWTPDAFVWAEHGGVLYDYFLVRGAMTDPFKGATTRIELVARHGEWAVYHQTRQTESSGR